MTESSRAPGVPSAKMTESARVLREPKSEMSKSSRVARVPKSELIQVLASPLGYREIKGLVSGGTGTRDDVCSS